MKRFLLKTLDVILTIVMVFSVLYAVFNLTMTFLPVEIQTKVFTALKMSGEYIATFSISATINAVVLISSKLLQIKTKADLSSKLAKAEKVIANGMQSNDIILERTNEIISNMNILQDLNNAVLSVQEVNAKRNVKASDKLFLKGEKEQYKKALTDIEKAKEKLSKIDNISKVFEKTETKVKEVIVKKEIDDMAGRV